MNEKNSETYGQDAWKQILKDSEKSTGRIKTEDEKNLKPLVEKATSEEQIRMIFDYLFEGKTREAQVIKSLANLSGEEIFNSPESKARTEEYVIQKLNEGKEEDLRFLSFLEVPSELLTVSEKIKQAVMKIIESSKDRLIIRDTIIRAINNLGFTPDEIKKLNIPEIFEPQDLEEAIFEATGKKSN